VRQPDVIIEAFSDENVSICAGIAATSIAQLRFLSSRERSPNHCVDR